MTAMKSEILNVQDQVIREVRKIKNDLAKKYSYDIDKMIRDARIRQEVSGRTILFPVDQEDSN